MDELGRSSTFLYERNCWCWWSRGNWVERKREQLARLELERPNTRWDASCQGIIALQQMCQTPETLFTTFQNIAKFFKTVPVGLNVYSLLSVWKRGNMEIWVVVFSVNNSDILYNNRLHLYSNYLYRRPNRLMAISISVSQTETSENWRDWCLNVEFIL